MIEVRAGARGRGQAPVDIAGAAIGSEGNLVVAEASSRRNITAIIGATAGGERRGADRR